MYVPGQGYKMESASAQEHIAKLKIQLIIHIDKCTKQSHCQLQAAGHGKDAKNQAFLLVSSSIF